MHAVKSPLPWMTSTASFLPHYMANTHGVLTSKEHCQFAPITNEMDIYF